MRGFLSFDEYFNADRARYYASLQMGLPVVTSTTAATTPTIRPWIEYFVGTLAQAARALRACAARLYHAMAPPAPPWEALSARQQQVLTRLLARAIADTPRATEVQAPEVQGWFSVSGNTAREWLSEWTASGFLCAGSRPRVCA